ncbi:MAG TPA: aminotransferase class I/II-fold pyridoxal phosphate-dependent enzyme [Bacteroidales bacterium]|nr:aminotransferase class I/II-fold pyridoxal phosphate-dependent enzyme [Bacteroidales bacterium]HOH22466.1 aminotransferase class I/II-fold pyridoxal phosphate-dependent enzyme [Bacteroidales bacterium]HPB58194.1 aminotransferase class I/II-fold pyridoxal phosphate-dependent enzyme [Bacteroidales bacterium]HPZ03123.1 aminotransferase class I/II-fold pyridoxal phosphate-dependent enzyme [Bacteroidales bacterium]HQB74745.1 aminotransferase class I/II-fold pyridoxal phosphate-dependent enzyme [B
MKEPLKFDSLLVHGTGMHDPYGAAVFPIYQTSTFRFKNAEHGAACFAGEDPGYIYTRMGNPTITALEQTLAKLEGGANGIVVSSGMAAVNTVYMAFLKSGDHVVSTDAVYGPSRVVMEKYWFRYGITATYVDTSNIENIKKAIQPNTKMLYLETPTNPTMAITDIKKASEIAHQHNMVVVVDNTFCSPVLQRPIELGADVVVHSMTKFLNGHADIVAGAIIVKTEELDKIVRPTMTMLGCNMDPTQAFMVNRGLRTLSIRVLKQQESAQILAEWLEKHPKIEWVSYPGLPSHPQYKLGQEQMDGPGSLLCFGLKGGYEAGKVLMDNLKFIYLAVSLGGVESLISHPASMTHSKMSKEARIASGISDGLVRFAVGIEDIEDIKKDLEQALDKC